MNAGLKNFWVFLNETNESFQQRYGNMKLKIPKILHCLLRNILSFYVGKNPQ